MSKRTRVKLITQRKRTFLPEKGEASDDPGVDYILNGVSTLCEVGYEFLMCIARPVCSLVRYIVVEGFNRIIKH